jgi:hypothetical protein
LYLFFGVLGSGLDLDLQNAGRREATQDNANRQKSPTCNKIKEREKRGGGNAHGGLEPAELKT